MTKAILISIQPQWTAKILNGEKTIEVRKKFPKDFRGWVYIYCTKGKPYLYQIPTLYETLYITENINEEDKYCCFNGKVVARFWCDNVEEIHFLSWMNERLRERIYKESCLTDKQITDYMGHNPTMYAIHISQLEIFEKPKKLSEFIKPR